MFFSQRLSIRYICKCKCTIGRYQLRKEDDKQIIALNESKTKVSYQLCCQAAFVRPPYVLL